MAKRRRSRHQQSFNNAVWASVGGVFFLVTAILIMASFSRQGVFLLWVNNLLTLNFGTGALVLPFLCLQLALICFQSRWIWSRPAMLVGGGLFFVGVTGITRGGRIGSSAFTLLSAMLTVPGAWLLFLGVIVAGMLILWQVSFKDILAWWHQFTTERRVQQEMANFTKEDEVAFVRQELTPVDEPSGETNHDDDNDTTDYQQVAESPAVDESAAQEVASPPSNQFVKIDLLDEEVMKKPAASPTPEVPADGKPPWQYPTLSLLDAVDGGEADRGDINANAQIIENTLDSFGIRARVVEINRGPSVTQYALEIAMGTKLSKITALAGDLALALAAPTGQIRIEAPIAGKSLVGVEVPNRRAAYVTLRKMLGNNQLKDHPSKLAVALGIDVNGKQIVGDIAKMPHILIAGATGSGKSVGINSFLCSLLFRCSPEELRLILVDPKRVELTMYQDIPHLLTPVIVDAGKVVAALKWACSEMDRRYKVLAQHRVRNLAAYNAQAGVAKLPQIVVVIDEFADVMMFSPNDTEEAVTRIAQMARAVGIHLILATQRPSVNVITGLIKANVPTRIAFNVASAMDSRVILDTTGAEKLLGNGDMLYVPPDQAKPIRIQGTFVSDADANKLTDFLKSQQWGTDYVEEVVSQFRTTGGKHAAVDEASTKRDERFMEAAQLLTQYDQASSSMLQRRMNLGYARAARLLDQLHEAGFVGPARGSKPREINTTALNNFLAAPNS